MSKLYVLLTLFIGQITWSYAQNSCGTLWDSQWAEEMLLKDRTYLNIPRGTRATIYVPIHYHIVTKADGTGGFPMTYLMQMHCELNERYTPSDIQFVFDTISYIKSAALYSYATSSISGDNATFNAYNTLNHCNVYLVDNPAGNCGYTYRPQTGGIQKRGGIFVKASRTSTTCSGPGSTTLAHEMGHWLDLPHTFFGWENVAAPNPAAAAPNKPPGVSWNSTERVARTGVNANCSSSGDFLCGTTPDYLSDRWSNCNATSSFAVYKDPLGVSFTVDASNYMSYSSDICASQFSADQMNQMRNAFQTKTDRIPYLSVPIAPFIDMDTVTCIAPDDKNKLPRNQVELRWNKVNQAESYHIMVLKGGSTLVNNPNFDILSNLILDTLVSDTFVKLNASLFPTAILSSNTNYYWKTRPVRRGNSCEDYTFTKNFKVAAFNVDFSVVNVKCKGEGNGAILISTSGGSSAPYSYEADILGPISDSTYNLEPGIYNITIKGTDPSDFANISAEVKNPTEMKVNIAVSNNVAVAFTEGGSGSYNYKWNTGETTSSITIDDKKNYTVTVTDFNGCSITKSLSVSGINIAELDSKEFMIYPNPIAENADFQLKINVIKNLPAQIQLNDLKGNTIKQWEVNLQQGENVEKLNAGSLSKGIYIVWIKSDGFSGYKRLVVQ